MCQMSINNGSNKRLRENEKGEEGDGQSASKKPKSDNRGPVIHYRALARWHKNETKGVETSVATAVECIPTELAGIVAGYVMDWKFDASGAMLSKWDGPDTDGSHPFCLGIESECARMHPLRCRMSSEIVVRSWRVRSHTWKPYEEGVGDTLYLKCDLICGCVLSSNPLYVVAEQSPEIARATSYGWTEQQVDDAEHYRGPIMFNYMVLTDILHRDMMKRIRL
jgi:hypothetical protein